MSNHIINMNKSNKSDNKYDQPNIPYLLVVDAYFFLTILGLKNGVLTIYDIFPEPHILSLSHWVQYVDIVIKVYDLKSTKMSNCAFLGRNLCIMSKYVVKTSGDNNYFKTKFPIKEKYML